MAALGIHHHRVDQPRVAFPFEPGALWPPGDIEALKLLDHQPFMAMCLGTHPAQRRQFVPVIESKDFRQVETRAGMCRHPCFEPAAPIDERQVADIFLTVEQHVVDPNESRIVADMRFCRCLAIQPLLQMIEIHRVEIVADQQFAIQNGTPAKRLDEIGEGGADIITRAGEQPGAVAVDDELHADPVPFPFSLIVIRRQPVEIAFLVDRVRQHHWMECLAVSDFGARSGAVEPGEQPGVRDFQPVPDLFDLGEVPAAIGCQRRLGQPRRHTDPQSACGELDHGPALGRARQVQQRGNMACKRAFWQGFDVVDERSQTRQLAVGIAVRCRPDQRDGFGHVADIIVGHQEQIRIDPLHGQLPQRACLEIGEAEITRDGRQRDAAIRIGRGAEIGRHRRDLGVA